MLGPTQRVPLRGSSSPASTRASTVLPAPFGPTTPTRSPRVITSSTSSSTGSSPNAKSASLERDDALAAARRAAQLERHLAPLEHRPLDLLHLVDLHLLHARLRGRALVVGDVRPVAEAPDRLLEPRDLLALGDPLLLLALELEPARDACRRSRRRARCGPCRGRARRSRSTHSSSRWRSWETMSTAPSNSSISRSSAVAAVHVEVRLGLVEQQQPRPPRQAGRERDELALAAAQLARGPRERVVVEPERGQVRARLALGALPAGSVHCAEQPLLVGERALHLAHVAGQRRVGEAALGLRELALERAQLRAGVEHGGERRRGRRPRRSGAARRARARGGW